MKKMMLVDAEVQAVLSCKCVWSRLATLARGCRRLQVLNLDAP